MKKIIFILLSICLFYMTGCTINNGQIHTIDTPSNEISVMEKHIVSITKDNYQNFLTVETNYVVGDIISISYHYFRGALSYAFYDGVVITYDYKSGNTTTERTLSLNVGGCGTIKTTTGRGGNTSYEITNVTGTIIYWI